jgi:hypothetical protein
VVGTCRPAANRRLHLVTPEPHREVELAVLVLATAVCARIDPTEWTPRELRHSFGSVLSDAGIPVEQIAQFVGHRGTTVTELVYRHQLRPGDPDWRDRHGSAAHTDPGSVDVMHLVTQPRKSGTRTGRNGSLTWWAILGSNQWCCPGG